MTNKKLASIIASKIILGEITLLELEKQVNEKLEEESMSDYLQKIYENLRKWLKNEISFEEIKEVGAVFEIIKDENKCSLEECVEILSKKTGKKVEYTREKLLSSNINNLYPGLHKLIYRFCGGILGVIPNQYWKSLDDESKYMLIMDLETKISNM